MDKKKALLSIKKTAKKFIVYTLEDDYKVYRLKGTGLKMRFPLCRNFDKKWASVPVCENKIVFDNYMGRGYGCNGKYVTEELLKTPGKYQIVWVVKDIEKSKKFFPESVELVEYLSPEAFYAYASAKIWVCNYHLIAYLYRGLQKKENQIFIQLWHGSFGIKKIEGDCNILTDDQVWTYLARKSSSITDYWISNSTFETNVYRRAFWNVSEVLEYGHPRNDLFFGDTESIAHKIKKLLEIPPETKLALYVPTFRDHEGAPIEALDPDRLLSGLASRFGGTWKFLLRLHPRAFGEKPYQDAQNIIDVTFYPDIQELLAAADVAITDYSSCIFDFMLSEKAGFLYAPDCEEYDAMRGLYYPLHDTPFPVARSNEELAACIEAFQEDTYKKAIREFLIQKGSRENGTACEKVKQLIDRNIENKRTKEC